MVNMNNNYNENSQKPYKVATSIGIYTGCEDFDAMFELADEIMYKNKPHIGTNKLREVVKTS